MKIRDMQDYSANLALFKQHCKKAAKQYSESETPVCKSEYTEEMTDKEKGFLEGCEWVRRAFNSLTAGYPLEYFLGL